MYFLLWHGVHGRELSNRKNQGKDGCQNGLKKGGVHDWVLSFLSPNEQYFCSYIVYELFDRMMVSTL
jgi:hypothetical protein